MPVITREDGERFVVPTYRDILSAKKVGLLKREIQLLSTNYGEYITLQKKSAVQYEIAFSPEPGYLLGETAWSYFNSPRDLIYCEEVPNTNDAILVIVKAGSVYLDGLFPKESIPDELVVFQTQQNNFEIYLYGDVPISQTDELGKFHLEASSVKSFQILDKPVFPTLPLLKTFQLQLVDATLKKYGIGVLPIKPVLFLLAIIALVWLAWWYLSSRKELPAVIISVVNPYQLYISQLASPDPADEISKLTQSVLLLYTIPGWSPATISYSGGNVRSSVKSQGLRTKALFAWAEKNRANVDVLPDGFYVSLNFPLNKRPNTNLIYDSKRVIGYLIDHLSFILPGNNLTLGVSINKGKYIETQITIKFDNITPTTLNLIGQQLKQLPLVLSSVSITFNELSLSGTIALTLLGN